EDPDTLVQRRGAAGLEAILKDAVDVFERKLQILDRKGFFGTLPGRRRALDRLLPTIRAAADPITRELYMSRAAEAAGVRKDVLERETGNEKREAVRAPTFPVSRVPFPALPASAEKALVLLIDRKSTRLNSSHVAISYAVFCLKKKTSSAPALHS